MNELVEEKTSADKLLEAAEGAEKKVEAAVETVADDLHVALPAVKSNPFGIRVVTLMTLLGGVAIVGNVFADSYSLHAVSIPFYFFRLIIGLLFIFIAFELNHRKLYAIWLFGTVVALGVMLNPYLSLLPILALAYLYSRRRHFSSMGQWEFRSLRIRY